MTIQQTIQQKLPQLSPELQQELLDFMEFLLSKAKARRLPSEYQLKFCIVLLMRPTSALSIMNSLIMLCPYHYDVQIRNEP